MQISEGNDKLGDIHNVSFDTSVCLIKTATCKSCYIEKLNKLRKKAREAWIKNFKEYQKDKERFFIKLSDYLYKNKVDIFRFFVSGDFPDLFFIDKAKELAEKFKDTYFYTYTRTWIIKEFNEKLEKLNELRNFTVWASVDYSTKGLYHLTKLPKCYVILQDEDEDIPPGMSLIFRDHKFRKKKMIYKNKTLVCPMENGLNLDFSCRKCKFCFKTIKYRTGLSPVKEVK